MTRILIITIILVSAIWLLGQRKTYTVKWRMREVVYEKCADTTCYKNHLVMHDLGTFTKTFPSLSEAKKFYKLAIKEERKTVLMINVKLE